IGATTEIPVFPAVGTPILHLARGGADDILVPAVAADLQPGSRLSSLKGDSGLECRYFLFCGGVKKLYFSPTFIPFDSALPPGAPFTASWHTPDYNAVHGAGV